MAPYFTELDGRPLIRGSGGSLRYFTWTDRQALLVGKVNGKWR